MDNGLIIGKKDEVSLISQVGMENLIKPLSKEILLFDTYIAGTMFLDDDSVLDQIHEGDKLILQREDNRFDPKAILILNEKKQKLGYVPEKDNVVFSRLMDAGKLLFGRIKNIGPKEDFKNIKISIYLMDF